MADISTSAFLLLPKLKVDESLFYEAFVVFSLKIAQFFKDVVRMNYWQTVVSAHNALLFAMFNV